MMIQIRLPVDLLSIEVLPRLDMPLGKCSLTRVDEDTTVVALEDAFFR